ncbi:hypothetical protein E4F39_30285 [Burkholderia pseudomallei]|nr:hypothetical protein [Burkholderia pseudomallei]MPT71224.1 hypothetical protein [Burkholderia pseudomallei]MPT78425.1 hypothetical protein [Burkholderia pseudomallei]MPT85061.1 hypothetical protein [Burkholderia pseudomallei]MPT90980.1 hypothetical protein [Burkholderia pseudomallei]
MTADGSEREAGRGEGGRSALTRARREPDTTGYARCPMPDARRPTPDARAAAGNGWVGRDDRRGKTVEVARAARRRTHRARRGPPPASLRSRRRRRTACAGSRSARAPRRAASASSRECAPCRC